MAKITPQTKTKYYLNKQGEFVIENYNYSKPFANFFPGIAGKYGIPMWAFYVNRGQCISSFGTTGKDHSILEFYPANKAWQLVSSHGFRTFLKVKSGKNSIFYEPFHDGYANLQYGITNSMRISSEKLIIEEDNITLGIKCRVEYFTIPNDTFAGLVRIISVKNTSNKSKEIQIIDGLPQIIPFGTNGWCLKEMSRTIEAWMITNNLENNVPFYKLDVDPSDRPEVVHIKEGNFYLAFDFKNTTSKIIKPIVDPEAIFGQVTDFSYPALFLANEKFLYPAKQATRNKTPCSMLFTQIKLAKNEEKIIYSVIGNVRNQATLNSLVKQITKFGYIENKLSQNTEIINKLKGEILTKSSSEPFNLYAGQTYLDNIIRGGYPEVFKSGTVFYLYSRKHGDPERDYNRFHLSPTYFSQGNGNYRDANQNRRSDTWFNPQIKDENIVFFMNLIQADGFNPLVIKGETFRLKENLNLEMILSSVIAKEDIQKLSVFLKNSFAPGELILFMEQNKIRPKSNYDDFLNLILSCAEKNQEAEHAEGFWTDHWSYNLDLIESYLKIYPEKKKELFFGKKVFSFFDNVEYVRSRNEKYVLYNNKPRQLHSLGLDNIKKELIHKRHKNPHFARTKQGYGEVYYTSLTTKLLCLALNKLASLDPFGCGIEMEANKPNWFDSLNGLPALFGSSSCETFELKRLLIMIQDALNNSGIDEIEVAEEIAEFFEKLSFLFNEETFAYWDKATTLKEDYRNKTRLGFSGNQVNLNLAKIDNFLDQALEKVNQGLKNSFDQTKGLYNSYFINEVVQYDIIKDHYIKPKKFKQIPVVLFLEGQMHALRIIQDKEKLLKLHKAVKNSALFDKALKMFKVTAPLALMPEEIGRCRIFSPGWLENESIWLHMEYKYILELLKKGLTEEFYAEFKNVLVPFQDAQRYGRSILENSSFIASSAFPDKKLHGNGFVARLSGSTAEFLEIWLTMNTGISPFTLDSNNQLILNFKPLLAGWLFDKTGKYSFNFLGKINVTYHNPKRKDTFGKNAAAVNKIVVYENSKPTEISSSFIPSVYAQKIRARQIEKIDIYLA